MMECQGKCREHAGQVKPVRIRSGTWDWGFWWYCDNAIQTDIANGLEVIPVYAHCMTCNLKVDPGAVYNDDDWYFHIVGARCGPVILISAAEAGMPDEVMDEIQERIEYIMGVLSEEQDGRDTESDQQADLSRDGC